MSDDCSYLNKSSYMLEHPKSRQYLNSNPKGYAEWFEKLSDWAISRKGSSNGESSETIR